MLMLNKYLKSPTMFLACLFGLIMLTGSGLLPLFPPVQAAPQDPRVTTGDAECGNQAGVPKGTVLVCEGGTQVIAGCANPKTPPPYIDGQTVECGDGSKATLEKTEQQAPEPTAEPLPTLDIDEKCAAQKNNSPEACVIFDKYLIPIMNLLIGAVGIIVAIMIIAGGIQYSASGGDPQAVNAAKSRIMNAIFALLAFAFLWSFLQWIVPGGIF